MRIDAGATSNYTDGAGKVWSADTGFTDGSRSDRSSTAIANTTDARLYQTERYSISEYAVAVPAGTYQVRPHFAETYPAITSAGQRIFSVNVEGSPILNMDVYNETGGLNRALVKTITVTVADGVLNIEFVKQVQSPMINAIEVLQQ